jgi:hypothetical protein
MRYRVFLVLILTLPRANALWVRSGADVPVERLIPNVERWIREHPNDANGYYTLGRIHYLAGDLQTRTVSYTLKTPKGSDLPLVFDELPTIELPTIEPGFGLTFDPLPDMDARSRLRAARLAEAERNLQRAVAMDPSQAIFHLTLGSVYLEMSRGEQNVASAKDLAEPKRDRQAEARQEMATAFSLSVKAERKEVQYRGGPYDIRVDVEAAVRYLEIGGGDLLLSRQMSDFLTQYFQPPADNLPVPITPILVPLQDTALLSELLDSSHTVSFDLDGTGLPQRWPWVRPETGILVWDPGKTGKVTSGRQLFGSITWWMFWENGYQALDALDDDHSGWLENGELAGLALWFDRDQDGVSDPGEVVPLESTPVAALSVQYDQREASGAWKAKQGVRLRSGTVLPTWDWVVQSIEVDRGPVSSRAGGF